VIALDANVLIAYYEENHVHAMRALPIIDTEEELAIHPLTLAECAVGPAGGGQLAMFQRRIERLGLTIWQPDPDHYYRIATLRATTSLKLPDCCVLDCARTMSATLATFDAHLAEVARSLGVAVDTGETSGEH